VSLTIQAITKAMKRMRNRVAVRHRVEVRNRMEVRNRVEVGNRMEVRNRVEVVYRVEGKNHEKARAIVNMCPVDPSAWTLVVAVQW
jgi:hypothetical protein